MATTMQAPTGVERPQHKRTTSSVLKNFVAARAHKRNPSVGTTLSSTKTENIVPITRDISKGLPLLPPYHPDVNHLLSGVNQSREGSRSSPRKSIEVYDDEQKKAGVLHKKTKSSISLKSLAGKEKEAAPENRSADSHQERKPKKSKSSTSLSALLSRPKSSKGLRKEEARQMKDKENQTPPGSAGMGPAPIWAQFSSQPMHDLGSSRKVPLNDMRGLHDEMALYTPQEYSPSKQRNFHGYQQPTLLRKAEPKPRPKSALLAAGASTTSLSETLSELRKTSIDRGAFGLSDRNHTTSRARSSIDSNRKESSPNKQRPNIENRKISAESSKSGLTMAKRGSRVMAAVAAWNGKAKEPTVEAREVIVDPKVIESAFEGLLDSRNVPQHMRDKMRSLDINIKADFIKQDKQVSTSASSMDGLMPRSTNDALPETGLISQSSFTSAPEGAGSAKIDETAVSKKSRPRSRTFTLSKGDLSPSKKPKSDRTISQSRPKSIDLGLSAGLKSPTLSGAGQEFAVYSKAPKPAVPEDFILYLRKLRKPEEVEVGKLHKLRQLLRNETVVWVDSFIIKGGMSEIVSLLHRIVEVEWREEHEDTLLHETLLCLKALCTTSLALSHLSSIQSTLFPMLLGMLFDEEKKGPSEFTTRSIIISLLFTHISTSPPNELVSRARAILSYLRDPAPPEEAQPPGFIASMHHSRPYRIWCKEIVNVTKEVFWIFLHHLNVIPYTNLLPPSTSSSSSENPPPSSSSSPSPTYTTTHFPRDRPPVPAAPYVGGVEWEATNYLAAHLDLLNGILACLPTRPERNALRQELKDSGFEKCMGASLRTCKEKFYGGVHAGLKTWVGAAVEDGWDVGAVREGVVGSGKGSPRKGKGKGEEGGGGAPRLEVTGLLGLGEGSRAGGEGVDEAEGWL